MNAQIINDIWDAHTHQRTKYSKEHDDHHGLMHVINIALTYMGGPYSFTKEVRRERLVKAAATLISAIEYIDRHE